MFTSVQYDNYSYVLVGGHSDMKEGHSLQIGNHCHEYKTFFTLIFPGVSQSNFSFGT